ncbi:phytanoyl-CoA dioxygenase family protein [Leptodontidium sp. 2 PMI_412]|nr:phytanoyl-CoA dioxygenase family protein [Leptodontidium sp. 2 PMI_412]
MSPSRLDASLPDAPADGFSAKLAADSKAAVIDDFQANSVTTSEVVSSLIKNGGCIIRNILDAGTLATIESDVRPWIPKDQPWTGEFFPPETRRVMGLVEKSKIFTDSIPGNKLYRDVCDELLTSWHESYHGQKLMKSESKPQLNNTIVFSIAPGAKRQELHRDDMNIHNKLEALSSHEDYKMGRDCTIGFFIAGKKTTKANGATRFIPRSHLWATSQPPMEELARHAELNPGDGFMMLASAYHGGSENSTIDQERLIYCCFMAKGFLRQEENQYLANSLESVKRYTPEMQKMIGYSVSSPFLGWVDLEDPRKLIMTEEELKLEAGKDLY